MINHYTPQEHLRQFVPPNDPGRIWRLDKANKQAKLLPIQSVGMEKNFYPDEYEALLRDKVEGPAWGPRNLLMRNEHVEPEGRMKLAIFTASMLTRGPHTRRKILEVLLHDAVTKTLSAYRDAIARLPEEARNVQERWATALQHWEEDMDARGPSEEVSRAIRSPQVPPRVARLLYEMTWRVISIPSGVLDRFLTNDTPAFIDEGYGLEPPGGELSFPISSRCALHVSWQGKRQQTVFVDGDTTLVREFNRRTVSRAERYMFSGSESNWVWQLVNSGGQRLRRVKW